MKSAAVLFVVVAALCYSATTRRVEDLEPRNSADIAERIGSIANAIVERVVALLRKSVAENALDPMALPDTSQEFTVEILTMAFKGTLHLTNGWLRDLLTMLPSGKADVQFDGDLLRISTDIEFTKLLIGYDYRITVMGLEPTGQLIGTAEGVRIAVNLTTNLNTYKTTLSRLAVLNATETTIRVQGDGGHNDILNAVVGLVTPYFQQNILSFVGGKVRPVLEEALVHLDIRDILGL